jgi:hypothetical protein
MLVRGINDKEHALAEALKNSITFAGKQQLCSITSPAPASSLAGLRLIASSNPIAHHTDPAPTLKAALQNT